MSNRFLDKKSYLDGLQPMTARGRASALVKAASQGGHRPSIAARNRFGFSASFSAAERALVVLMENGGIALGIGRFVNGLLDGIPGGNLLPRAIVDNLVAHVEEKIRQATDNLLESAEMALNRYSAAAPDPYGEVVVLRNGQAFYDHLKNNLIRLSEANKFIDLFVLTHGGRNSIALEGGTHVTGDRIREIRSVHNGGRAIRLRSVYQMNCIGSSLNQAWIDIGAKAAAGSAENNFIPEPMMYFFFQNWKNGRSFTESITDAYQRTIDLIETVITAGVRAVAPGASLIPGFDRLVEELADIANRQFIVDSRPLITGDGSVSITADNLSFGQMLRTRSFSIVPVGQSQSRLVLPRAMQGPPPRTTTYRVSQQAIDFIKSFEAFRANLYNDPAGHCSIGYGHLVHSGNCDGRDSEAPFSGGVTEERATEMMRAHLEGVERAVNEAVTAEINQNQFDALVSFAYNIGIGRAAAGGQQGTGFLGSNLLRRLNAGDYNAVPLELARWNKAGGQVLPGLTRRRAAEGRMFANGDYSTGQSFAQMRSGDPITEAAQAPEGNERPDMAPGAPGRAMGIGDAPVMAHCPSVPADTAGTAHFTLAEFESRDGASTPRGVVGNIQTVMNQLEVLRGELGAPITINSGYRSQAHNSAIGGEANSQHLCGRAADISVRGHTPAQVHARIEELIAAGRMMQGGLGLYDTFVHYDTRGNRVRWDRRTPAAAGQSLSADPIAAAAHETEEGERPDTGVPAAAMETPISAHCPVNAASDASTAHFRLAEFRSKDGAATPAGVVGNIQVLMEQLEELRASAGGVPIEIVSGYRSPAHNKAVGGKPRSQHLCGRAADIRISGHTPAQVHTKVEELISTGRMREGGLGLYDTFVHYDTRGTRARWSG